eukprot:20029-Pelagococcus_subviridis.AAC.1
MACAGVQEKPYRRLTRPRRPYPKPTQMRSTCPKTRRPCASLLYICSAHTLSLCRKGGSVCVREIPPLAVVWATLFRGTLHVRQFDWGGRLLKGIGGVR